MFLVSAPCVVILCKLTPSPCSYVGGLFGTWQGVSPSSNYSWIFQLCDTMEGARPVNISSVYLNGTISNTTAAGLPKWRNNTVPQAVPATGIGREKALANFAAWHKYEILPEVQCKLHQLPSHRDPLELERKTDTISLCQSGIPRLGRRPLRWMPRYIQRHQPYVYRLVC